MLVKIEVKQPFPPITGFKLMNAIQGAVFCEDSHRGIIMVFRDRAQTALDWLQAHGYPDASIDS